MTKKHFETIAKAIKDKRNRLAYSGQTRPATGAQIVDALVECFEQINPKFDRKRFLEASQ